MRKRIVIAPQAKRDFTEIVAWYRRKMGAGPAAKVARTLQAGIRATLEIEAAAASRPDLPDGYVRVVAKAHLVIFQIEVDTVRIVRIVHSARDLPAALTDAD
jgi:plasmid stabilization system protein ParE